MDRSSSAELSSAPASDAEPPNYDPFARPTAQAAGGGYHHAAGAPHSNGATVGGSVHAAPASARQDPAPAPKKPRKPRTMKPKDASAAGDTSSKEKPARKPRISGATAGAKKRTKTETREQTPSVQNVLQATDLQSSRLNQPVTLHQRAETSTLSSEAAKTSLSGLLKQEPSMNTTQNNFSSPYNTGPPAPPQPTPPRSTPMYDPVRGFTSHRTSDPPHNPTTMHSIAHTPPRPVSRPGSSPIDIVNIIEPQTGQAIQTAPSPLRTFVSHAETHSQVGRPVGEPPQISSSAMDLDVPSTEIVDGRKPSITKKVSSEAPTRATSPKPPRAKEQAPPLPTGSGLLSASMFGGESNIDSNENKASGPNIVLHIDLKDPKNKVINFARLAEEKYGFAALYPRQAAQRERLARVAAAGAALERSASASKHGGTSAGESGDDEGSVDIDRESDNDGDVNMSGINGLNETANSGTDGAEPKRKRRRKVEEYDQEDPFIDDSEQLWEAQATASKDGFFVYCGPLVAEGEKPNVERYVTGMIQEVSDANSYLGRMVQPREVVDVAEEVVQALEVAVVLELLHSRRRKEIPLVDQRLDQGPGVALRLVNHGSRRLNDNRWCRRGRRTYRFQRQRWLPRRYQTKRSRKPQRRCQDHRPQDLMLRKLGIFVIMPTSVKILKCSYNCMGLM